MGQKVNPVGFRTGIVVGWKSRWYASKQEFSDLLVEDQKIRKFIKNHPTKVQYRNAGIDRIEIERTRDEVRVLLYVARPGYIIGKKGQDVEVLQEELQTLIGRRVNLKIEEVSRPEIMAQLVAEDIAQQIAKRASFRRTMKRSIEQTMDAGAKGIKIQMAGRLGGAEMARGKGQRWISSTQHFASEDRLRFCRSGNTARNIGIQVWINQGTYAGDASDGADAQAGQAPKKPKRTYKR